MFRERISIAFGMTGSLDSRPCTGHNVYLFYCLYVLTEDCGLHCHFPTGAGGSEK